jgi:hypothetical protein
MMHGRAMLCLVSGAAAFMLSPSIRADDFGKVYYDKKNDQLVVTMLYRGTNPNHNFSLKWGQCEAQQSGDLPGVTVDVLDDQYEDSEEQDFKKTTHFSLTNLPCRPVLVTLRSAPRFFYSLTIR